MRMHLGLSCNFLNVYTIPYRVQYTFTRIHVRISNGHTREGPRGENRACRTSRRTSRRGSSCVSAKMSVSVSMSVPWNSSLIQRLQSRYISYVHGRPTTSSSVSVQVSHSLKSHSAHGGTNPSASGLRAVVGASTDIAWSI